MILELLILIIGIAMLMLAHYLRNKEQHATTVEPFEQKVALLDDEAYLYACPTGYQSYHLSNGNTACCDGEIVANVCMSDKACLLSGRGTDKMPKCTEVLMANNKERAKDQCPSSMTSYFENTTTHKKGCTDGPLNVTLDAPRNASQPTCIIYSTMDEDLNSVDSCFNQKELKNAACFGNNCTTSLVQPIKNKPVQIAIGFTDSSGMHRVAYTRASMERFLDATKPNWRNQGMNLDKNINVAEVAKAFYVDRTIQQNDIEL